MPSRGVTAGAVGAVTLGVVSIVGWVILSSLDGHQRIAAQEKARAEGTSSGAARSNSAQRVKVKVAHPAGGRDDRTTEQPGRVNAFWTANLFAQVSGNLKTQSVDIGDEVKEGQVLAVIDAPERQREVEHAAALLKQAEAQVQLMTARVSTAEADLEGAETSVETSKADLERAQAMLTLRDKQYQRFKSLLDQKSIEERLVEEKLDQKEAAAADVRATKGAIATSLAKVTSARAQLEEAKAELADAHAAVAVAEAQLAKEKVYESYTRIVCPYDGVITRRNFDLGDFVRDAGNGGTTPLLAVARTDLMRVVVQIPDADVVATRVGNEAKIKVQTLPDQVFAGRVSRTSMSEDRRNLTMRTEIDLPNPDKILFDGMYGRVAIQLGTGGSSMTVPSSAVVDVPGGGSGVFVVRDGVARLTPVKVGSNDGVRAEIRTGLDAKDQIIVRPGQQFSDGTPVEAIEETKR